MITHSTDLAVFLVVYGSVHRLTLVDLIIKCIWDLGLYGTGDKRMAQEQCKECERGLSRLPGVTNFRELTLSIYPQSDPNTLCDSS